MKLLTVLFFLLGFAQISYAEQVVQCLGTLVHDNSPVVAKVYSEAEAGKIIIETIIDKIEGTTKVDLLPNSRVVIYDNNFRMDFTVSRMTPASPVQAFRDGAFFVEDFYCIPVN